MYDFTEEELNKVLENYTISHEPLVLKQFPAKEKKKYMLLTKIIQMIPKNQQLTEFEVNDILSPIYEDYVLIRRYLIDYKFLLRTKDGQSYWVNK